MCEITPYRLKGRGGEGLTYRRCRAPGADNRAEPETHRDLIVRVAGYSDYFCEPTKGLQDEFIERTEQKGL